MTKIDELAKEEISTFENIPAFKQAKKGSSFEILYSFYKFLTSEEKTILQILYNSNDPLSIRQIRKKFAIEVALKFKEQIKKIPFILKKLKKGKFKDNIWYVEITPSFEDVLKNLKDVEVTSLISFLNKISPEKIPSYYKIESILENFEKQGLVVRRELTGRKAENIWCLSPQFSRILIEVVKDIKEKGNNSELEMNLLRMIVGRTSLLF